MPDTHDLRITPRTVLQQAVEKLRDAILLGVFKPGDKLVEAELCESLGVSRPSVREALRSLEAERLVAIIPNRGPHIPVLTWQIAADIYQARALLESEAAALCAKCTNPTEVQAMHGALGDFKTALHAKDLKGQIITTSHFYDAMLRMCGNSIIAEILQGLHARINFLRGRSMSLPGRAKLSLDEMTAILDAIEYQDPRAARRAAAHHVQQAQAAAKVSCDNWTS